MVKANQYQYTVALRNRAQFASQLGSYVYIALYTSCRQLASDAQGGEKFAPSHPVIKAEENRRSGRPDLSRLRRASPLPDD